MISKINVNINIMKVLGLIVVLIGALINWLWFPIFDWFGHRFDMFVPATKWHLFWAVFVVTMLCSKD